MYILLVPLFIAVLFLIGILLLIRRLLLAGAFFIIVAGILNFYTQTVPLHISYYFNDTQKKENQIRVLSYNIKYNSDYLRHNNDSLSALVSFLQGQHADLLILPESRLNSTNTALREKLDNLYPYNLECGYEGNSFYIETFVFSRYPIRNVRQYGKHYIYEMDIMVSEGFTIKLIACHLKSNQSNSSLTKAEGLLGNIRKGYVTRAMEARMIADSLRHYQGPVIIAGDLNDISGSEALRSLQYGLKLDDAWWKSGFGYGATSLSKHLYFRLDHILFSHHFKSSYIAIPKTDFSDHYPLITDLEIR